MDAAEPGGVSLRALVNPVKTSWALTVTAPKKGRAARDARDLWAGLAGCAAESA
jgi:hypothetical protein